MPHVLRCLKGRETFPAGTVMNLCPEHGCPVEIHLDLDAIAKSHPAGKWFNPAEPSLWRYGALLPLNLEIASHQEHILDGNSPIQAGHTPLVPFETHPVAQTLSLDLRVKDEGEPHSGFGGNPTRSFKDRGMAMVVAMARASGLTKLAVPTQGNAGDSLAFYGDRLDLQVAVTMPASTPAPIREAVQQISMRNPKIIYHPTDGPTIKESGEVMKAEYLPQGYFSVATFQEPGWRIEGKKTMGLEIAEPGIWDEAWTLPDVIIYPTGGGTGILGMWKAFHELIHLGLIHQDQLPRMICVQSEGTAPLVEAMGRGLSDTAGLVQEPGNTAAVGLNVPGGVGHFRVLEIIRESGGTALRIPESAMIHEEEQALRLMGLHLCPEGAATLAALEMLADDGAIRPGERVVAFNTGSPFKYRHQS